MKRTLDKLQTYASALETELENILKFWIDFSVDEINGGFVGRIDEHHVIDYSSAKGAVLNARILWSFSAAYNLKADPSYLKMAERAYEYILANFIDPDFGGVYWLLDAEGKPLDTKKQTYAIAFTIYALSTYYTTSQNEAAKTAALKLYHDLTAHSYDQVNGGYAEAFGRDWAIISDLRLSAKDANEKKTMNTHLHVLEAFTTLYSIWPEHELKQKIIELIDNFRQHIIHPETGNLILFMEENWKAKSDTVSYGHDIEASWLLLEAAEVIKDELLIAELKKTAVQLAEVSLKGTDTDGSLWYEYKPAENEWIKEKHWWVQAEGMVGFFNAWQISRDERFLKAGSDNWDFVQSSIIDHKNGEWFWGITADGKLMPGEDKAGIWKCPYHNSRACIELIRRIRAEQIRENFS